MKICTNNLLIVTIALITLNSAICTDVVPVYMWKTSKFMEHIPVLHKISEDSFKDILLENTKNSYIVIFAENTLSPEDFAQRDRSGETPYSNLLGLKKSAKVNYISHVQNPIRAVKQLDQEIIEISVDSLLDNLIVPDNNILIVNLNDAKDDEHRYDMLKRHDSAINFIYNKIREQHDNVLAIYTGHHTSWIAPGEMGTHNRKTRSLLAETSSTITEATSDNRTLFKTEYALLYVSDLAMYKPTNVSINDFKSTVEHTDSSVTLTLTGSDVEINFLFTLVESGYWYLSFLTVKSDGKEVNLTSSNDIYAPMQFSYHCNNIVFSHDDHILTLPGFQIQPFTENGNISTTKFGDAYNCVGFTSIPIWSGLFVTFILLLIMTFGLIMMMDIKTMDRFDDAKGKTITINTSE